ncbi:MAG: universal stress protein [Armatimonadota bacterium]
MSDYNVIVGVANPENVPGLMRLGCLLANEYAGRVTAVTVIETEHAPTPVTLAHHDRMSLGYELLEVAEQIARCCGVQFSGRIVVLRGVAEALDEVAEAEHARVIIVGFSERAHPDGDDAEFERLIDEIAHRASCDLLVARLREPERYDRVLVPVRQRLDLEIRRDLVTALHNQLGSQIDVVHFACTEAEAAAKHDELLAWLQDRGVAEWVKLRVDVHDDPGAAIVAASQHYDAVVLGTSPLHEVRRRYFGAVPEHVAAHARCSTFLLRAHDILPGA